MFSQIKSDSDHSRCDQVGQLSSQVPGSRSRAAAVASIMLVPRLDISDNMFTPWAQGYKSKARWPSYGC
jgi:hypothetical protein